MNQSQIIMEELRDVGGFPDLSMWKNPTKSEMDQIPADVRGFVLPSGDVFLANVGDAIKGLHSSLLGRAAGVFPEHKKALKKLEREFTNKLNAGTDHEFGITIQRVGDSKAFILGDSEGAVASMSSKKLPLGKRQNVINIKKHLKATRKKGMSHIGFRLPPFFVGIK